jgi:hypothetical protein
MLGAAGQYIGLNAKTQQLFYGVLGGFRFKFLGCIQIGHQGQVNDQAVVAPQFPAQLPHRLHVGQRFDVAHRTAQFRDDQVVLAGLSEQQHPALDLVGNVRDHLHRFAEVVARPFLVDYRLVDSAGGDVVGTGGGGVQKRS